jgi:predicted dehydrogenase
VSRAGLPDSESGGDEPGEELAGPDRFGAGGHRHVVEVLGDVVVVALERPPRDAQLGGDEGVQLVEGHVADQVRPPAAAPVPDGGVDQDRHGRQCARGTSVVPVTAEIRWGIVGPGRIAENVIADFPHVEGARPVAVASRSEERGADFARRHGLERSYGSYAGILADPDVDVLYVATPHPQHHAVALGAVDAGKALLIEKTFTATTAGAAEVVERARARDVFVMEAMWTRFQPAVVALRELVAEGAIGEVRSVQADLGVAREYDPRDRLFALELGGGALLDLGVYVVSFAQMLLGTPDTVAVTGSRFPTGVDAEAALLLGWADGRSATLTTSLRHPTPGQARVFGTTGWIDVLPRFHHPDTIVLHRDGAEPETLTRPATGTGYAHELAEVTACLQAGRTESAVMPLADTLAVQAVLEQAAGQLGVRHAEDPHAL